MFTKKNTVALIILSILILVIIAYRSAKLGQIKNNLSEQAIVIAEPLWNYNTDLLGGYLNAMAIKHNYHELKVIWEDGSLFYEIINTKMSNLDKLLLRIGLVPKRKFEQDIYFEKELIGSIVVVWRDTSIYFYSYAILISILLLVIANLYSKILGAKKNLEAKIMVIQEQMVELKSQKDYIEEVFNVVPEGLITIDKEKNCIGSNLSFEKIVESYATDRDVSAVRKIFLNKLQSQLHQKNHGQYSMTIDPYTINIEFSSAIIPSFHNIDRVVSLRDISKITAMERQLAQSQKLESVGRLAAGIAHEINTPTQYVLSNVDFIMESYEDLSSLIDLLEPFTEHDVKKTAEGLVEDIRGKLVEIDWEYLKEEIPSALNQSKEGLRRISSIVSAMKQFSHPSGEKTELHDINSAVENTVAVARNEWKYIAEVNLQLDPALPQIPCYLDELNQVFLAMIVNGAHAIEERYGKNSESKGVITITTQLLEGHAVICIKDDGKGIAQNIREKVFDPFFTTKEVNKGTGQGLAIAHDVIVNRHGGVISFQSELNLGTTFTISLPTHREP